MSPYLRHTVYSIAFAAVLHPAISVAANASADFDQDVKAVQALYMSGQFQALEKRLDQLLANKSGIDANDASVAYWAFRRQIPAPGVKVGELKRIDLWKQQVPSSKYVAYAESRYWYATAWNARGNSAAGEVEDAGWREYFKLIAKAQTILLDLPESARENPLWYSQMLTLSQDGKNSAFSPDVLVEKAATKWPFYYDIYELRLTRLVPKWGGSWAEVDAFIDRWDKKNAKAEDSTLYARLYGSLQTQTVPVDILQQRWKRMDSSFARLVSRYPQARLKNQYASYACYAGDMKKYREIIAKIKPDELLPAEWLYEASYPACQRLSSINQNAAS